jgi:hypothetical protein
MTDEPSVYDVLKAIEALASKRHEQYATRVEIAGYLGVSSEDISREGSPPTGPLGKALDEGLIEENADYAGYWRLKPDGQTMLDSAMLNG